MKKGISKWLIAALAVVAALSQVGVLPPVLADVADVVFGELEAE